MSVSALNPMGFSWQQTMLRVKNGVESVKFYEKNFNMRLIHVYKFPQWSFDLYFLAILDENESELPFTIPSPESEKYLWNMRLGNTCLELTHNYGSESDSTFQINNGNVEPFRGFGHIAFMCSDVDHSCSLLESNNVEFQKKPNEGKMKGLAFAKDLDGYWLEIIPRSSKSIRRQPYTLAQTMLRVKDPIKSLYFYRDLLGMTLLRESHYSDFSLYFLAHLPEGTIIPIDEDEKREYIKNMFIPVLELTHNHGTENNPDFSYHNGNDQDKGQLRGFGHIGFLCDNLDESCSYLESKGVNFKKKPTEGTMRNLAFAYDPDNYWIEIIQRNGITM